MKKNAQIYLLAGIIAVISVFMLTCSSPNGPDSGCAVPAVPRNVTAAPLSATSVKVSWNAIPVATAYEVFRSTSQGAGYVVLMDVEDTTYIDSSGLSPSTAYYYKIRARNDCGQSAQSSYAQATTNACLKPTIPTNISAEVLSAISIKISWDAVPAATLYEVYHSTSEAGAYGLIDTVMNKTNYTNDGLSPSSTHYYKVTAKNTCGESARSESVSATTIACPKPAAPANATAEAVSSSSIKISWDKVETALTYKIYRSATSTGTYLPIGNTSGNANVTYTDEELDLNTTYYYQVTAESYCEESAPSIYTFAETMNCSNIPMPPSNIKAETKSQTEITVSWDAVSGAKYYNIYIDQDNISTGYYLAVGNLSSTYKSYTISGFSPASTYRFKMSAQNDCGESAKSTDFATATTNSCDLDILPNPTNVSATALSARSVKITWDKVEDAVYDVYRGTERGGTYWTVAGSRNLTVTSFTDTTVSSSTMYYYAVESRNSCGESAGFGTPVSVTTMCETSIPLNVTAAAKPNQTIEITWTPVSGAGVYYVYRSTSQNGVYAPVGNISAPPFTDSGLTPVTAYHYKVTAKTVDCDESRMSERVSAITQ